MKHWVRCECPSIHAVLFLSRFFVRQIRGRERYIVMEILHGWELASTLPKKKKIRASPSPRIWGRNRPLIDGRPIPRKYNKSRYAALALFARHCVDSDEGDKTARVHGSAGVRLESAVICITADPRGDKHMNRKSLRHDYVTTNIARDVRNCECKG